jgi:hypothetical protein
MKRLFVAALTGTAIPAFWLSRRYRRDMNAARARLAAFERHVIATPWGQVEYAEQGTGAPVLVVHGIFTPRQRLLSVRGLLPGRRLIAPSRFASPDFCRMPVAGQADASPLC